MEQQKPKYRYMGSALDEELERYSEMIVGEEDPLCLVEVISMYFDVWPFKDVSLKCWKETTDRLLKTLSSLETRYFRDNLQVAEMCEDDRTVAVAIFKLFQRILGYSKQRHVVSISDQVMGFIYCMEMEVVMEAYKVLVFSLYHSMGADEFLESQDMLFRCLEIDPETLDTGNVLGLSGRFNNNIPEESFSGDSWHEVLDRGSREYGKENFVFEFRKRLCGGDRTVGNTLRILGTCAFLTLLKEGNLFDEIASRIDFAEIQETVVGDSLTRDMEFGIMSLLEVLVYEGFDFSRISQTLQLGDSDGIFYRKLSSRHPRHGLEEHTVFFVYEAIVGNQKSKYLRTEVVVENLLGLGECSPDVRYHLLHALRDHCKDPHSSCISEFVSRGGLSVLFEYLRHVDDCDVYEDVNRRCALKLLKEMYMRDDRHAIGVGSFEDSPLLDIVIGMIRGSYVLNTHLVSQCVRILTCFMFDEPLNFPTFAEKGVSVVLDVFQEMELSLEQVSVLISYIDAFSLNLDFQSRMVEGGYLLRLLLLCREEEFLGCSRGAGKVFSLLNVLIMHHPSFRQDVLKFYRMTIVYLKNLFESEARSKCGSLEYCTRIFDGLFSLIEQMQLYPSGDEIDVFFHEISDLVINPRYCYRMGNVFRGSFGEVYRYIHNVLMPGGAEPFRTLIQSTGEIVLLGSDILSDGKHSGDLVLSYDKQIALASLVCEDSMEKMENDTAAELFDEMSRLFLMLIQIQDVFLPIADVGEHRFLSAYKSTRSSLEEDTSEKVDMVCILKSIYLCNRFLLQQLYPQMLETSFDRTVELVRRIMETCFGDADEGGETHDSTVVQGLSFLSGLSLFRTEHYKIFMNREFSRRFFVSDLRSRRSKAVIDFFVSHLSGRFEEEPRLRHEFLKYLRDSRMEEPPDIHDIEVNNMVIEAVGKIFGEWSYNPPGRVCREEESMILEIYERFYTSPLCMNLVVRRILRSARYTMRLVRIRAFSSFQHFLRRDRRVYDHSCFIVNNFFEYSDEFVEMASHVLLFATINMCAHKIDLVGVGGKVSGLIGSDVSFQKILFFLTMYLRVLRHTRMCIPEGFEFEGLIARTRTHEDVVNMMVLFSYVIQPDMESILDNLVFPQRRMDESDGPFLKSNSFLIYRDYEEFVRTCVRKTEPGLGSTCVHLVSRCHKIYPGYEDGGEGSDGLPKLLIRTLARHLETREYSEISAQLLSGILFNSPSYICELQECGACEVAYENHIRGSEESQCRVGGEARWTTVLVANMLHSEMCVFKKKHPDNETSSGNGLLGDVKMELAGGCLRISNLVLQKIESRCEEEFSNGVFTLLKSITGVFVVKQENEERSMVERHRELSRFQEAAGMFERVMRRVCEVEDDSPRYSVCVQHSLEYLYKAFEHCYGEFPQDSSEHEGDAADMEYYSIASEENEFIGNFLDSDGSYSNNLPFYVDGGSDDTFVEEDVSSDSSDQSSNVVFLKTMDRGCEISTSVHILKSEYCSMSSEVRGEIESLVCERLYFDLLCDRCSVYERMRSRDTNIPRDMSCELDNPRVVGRHYDEDSSSGEESSSSDSESGSHRVLSKRRSVWNFNATESEDGHTRVSVSYEGGDAGREVYPVDGVDGGEAEYEYEGSSESSVGSENGEVPDMSPDVLNSMTEEELMETARRYFDERRSRALTYVPLNVSFYSQLAPSARSVFEEMERIYREDFFYDIRVDSPEDSRAGDVRGRVVEIDEEVFRRFVDKSIVERGFLFARSRKLVEVLCRSPSMQRITFEVSSQTLCCIDKFSEDVCLIDEHTTMVFERSVHLLIGIVRDAEGYERYFRESPVTVAHVFGILEKTRMTNGIFRLVTRFSTIFRSDKDLVFDVDMDLTKVLGCTNRIHDSECFGILEEFVENTVSHFYHRFADVILKEIDILFSRLSEQLRIFRLSNSSDNQKTFLRLWKILLKVVRGDTSPQRNDEVVQLMHHGFWSVFFHGLGEKRSVEELLGVSDVFEAFFIVGRVFEERFGRMAEGDGTEAEQLRELKRSYEEIVEGQSQHINLLVGEQPDRFFRSFGGLVKHSILNFGNKRRYLARKLHCEGTDRSPLSYCVYVDRKNVLRSSYFQVMAKSPEEFRTRRLEIKISGEEGLDYGGLSREWFGLLVKELLDPNFVLFEFSSEDKTTVVPCKDSHANPEHLSYFKFVGRILAKAIMDGNFINLHLSKFVYKHILGRSCGLDDLQQADPEFHKSLMWIRDNHVDESLGLTFSFDEMSFGVHRTRELVPGGSEIFVVESNKMEYVELAARHRLFDGIELQLSALKLGLFEVVGEETLRIFDENELELLICGVPDINIDDWKNNTLYYGYTEGSKTIGWFWKAVKSFGAVERAKLLQFVTGTSTLPLEGFSHLQGNNEVQKFSIHKISDKMDSLPTAHTCFNQLVLPEYSSYESLLKCLSLAINECSTGFGFI